MIFAARIPKRHGLICCRIGAGGVMLFSTFLAIEVGPGSQYLAWSRLLIPLALLSATVAGIGVALTASWCPREWRLSARGGAAILIGAAIGGSAMAELAEFWMTPDWMSSFTMTLFRMFVSGILTGIGLIDFANQASKLESIGPYDDFMIRDSIRRNAVRVAGVAIVIAANLTFIKYATLSAKTTDRLGASYPAMAFGLAGTILVLGLTLLAPIPPYDGAYD